MKKSKVEIIVGIFVLIGIICIGYLSIKLGKIEWFGDSHYPIYARFQTATGLKVGATIEIAGVSVGLVEAIELDPEDQIAVVKLKIKNGIELDDDVIASIKTSGLIGSKFINILPGGSGDMLEPGGTIIETYSALDIEEMISKYAFGSVED
jgi:phospholipid/cholesterol/gamma-HCH transport system substrate-binding protein